MSVEGYYGTGRRKTAVARVWLRPGSGTITINKRPIADYFGRATARMVVAQPLEITETMSSYDVSANVNGGGGCGQAEAIRHGISRALLELNPDFRGTLKKAGFVTRDSRIKERKKYGQKGARARFQFSKR